MSITFHEKQAFHELIYKIKIKIIMKDEDVTLFNQTKYELNPSPS